MRILPADLLPPAEDPTKDPDRAARADLARNRAIANAMLVGMLGLVLGSYAVPPGIVPVFWVSLLQASAKAGFVGGIADWFAVTALFRHPLGLPIPHTAIIPHEKQRLGDALGRFVSRHVVTEDEVTRVMGEIDVAGLLRSVLTDDAIVKQLSGALARYLPRLLATVEDGRARRTAARLLPRLIGGEAGGRLVVRALRGLTDNGRHQEVLGFILGKLREAMAEKEADLKDVIEARVREQGGRLIGWTLGATIAKRVLASVNAEMDRMDPQGSSLRDAFDEWVRHEINRMDSDPARAAELGRALRRVISHDTVQVWVWDIWSRLRRALEDDAARPDGRTRVALEDMVRDLGVMITNDPATAAGIQRIAARSIKTLLPTVQTRIAGFIANVIGNWDTATIVDRLELRVGRDLQYVRMNGTLVGFFVGGLTYLALMAMFGHVAF